MNCEGPVLSLQPAVSRPPPAHFEPDFVQSSGAHPSQITHSTLGVATNMSSSGRGHLAVHSKVRSSSVADCKSVPNSPQMMQLHLKKEFTNTLSPSASFSHSLPRASSAEPEAVPNLSQSLSISGSPKVPFASRIRRQPTVDTYSFSKEEFEDYTRVNQYKVLDIIGHGSYGIVRKATDENDGVYAMKILNKKKLLRKGFGGRVRPGMKPRSSPRENIEREVAILKKLDHPNVVRLFEVLDDPQEDDLILVFEYIQKGPVIDKLPMDERFSEDQSRDYFLDLVLGLEFLHSQHVIHRDIKPQNLLLDNSNRIKIADFGVSEQIAKVESNISRWAGTPAFVAPETLSSSNSFKGQAVDMWAAGVTLFCFAFGKVPWSPPSIPELYEMIQTSELPIPKDVSVSAELQDLLWKLLTKDPEKRISISEVREHTWILKTSRTIPSKEENCLEEINVSEEDIQSAIKPFYTPIHILMMIKQMAKRRSLRNPKMYSPPPSPQTSPRRVTSPVTSPLKKSLAASSEASQGKREKFVQSHAMPSIYIENERD